MKKVVVLKVEFDDDKIKLKAMKSVSTISGIESISMDARDKKMTVTGDIDPVAVVAKLRKICYVEIVSVGPAKEPDKKREEPKKDDKNKDDHKKEEANEDPAHFLKGYHQPYPYVYGYPYYGSVHEYHDEPPYLGKHKKHDAKKTGPKLKAPVVADLPPNPVADVSSITKDTTYKGKAKYYVGLEDELENLMNHVITEESDKLQVISITGMAGIGKTTMARRIFHDPIIADEFPIMIWVSTSQEFDMKRLCLTILKSFTSRDMSGKSVAELLIIVPKYLRMVKFFMVVHEVWEVQTWDQIKQVLPMENSKSTVLVTTRISELAHSAAGNDDTVHNLRFLNDKESWDLLRLEVFGRINGCPDELEVVGKSIAHLCRGLPLLVVVVAGILVYKMSRVASEINAFKEEWEHLHDSFTARVNYANSLEVIRDMISLSYFALQDYQKECFLYLGMLPEETEIPVWRLTQLWIQEGLIVEKQEQSLEETAKDNLMELISMNLVIADKVDISGEVKTFHVHALIREFCKWSASARGLNFFREIKMGDQGNFEPPISDLDRNGRLCIHSHVYQFLSEKPKIPKARSFLCLPKTPVILENEDVSNFTQAFDLVRVLDASSIRFPKFPTELTLLVLLRYITLSCDELMILPEAISDLWNLRTLVVDTLSPTLEVKADIWKLIHLRYLKTKASMSLTKWEGSGCENLHTLTRLSPQSFTNDVPSKAKNLKELGIRGMLSHSMNFEKLDYLEKLKLQHDVLEYPLAGLPEQNSFPPNLRFLVLSGTFLDWKHVSVLEMLGALEVLKLKDNAFTGDFWEVADGGFRCLEALSISQADLKYWSVSSDSFPKLRNLELKKCEKLLEVPLELGENLEKLSMSYVTRYAVTCAEIIEQTRTANGAEFKLEIHHADV